MVKGGERTWVSVCGTDTILPSFLIPRFSSLTVLAARIIFDALEKADGEPIDYTTVLHGNLADQVPKLRDLNFITYTDPIDPGRFVVFKRKSLIHGWRRAKLNNPSISREFDNAM